MLDNQEEIKFKEYEIIRNDRNREGGGIMLAVKGSLTMLQWKLEELRCLNRVFGF